MGGCGGTAPRGPARRRRARTAAARDDADRHDPYGAQARGERAAGADAAPCRAGVPAPLRRDASQPNGEPMSTIARRTFLGTGLMAAGGALLAPRLTFAAAAGDSRLIVVLMRGALDGLAAVPPHGDRDYAGLRAELAIAPPGGANGALPLDALFGLHPKLDF